jgi:hypothetical protein
VPDAISFPQKDSSEFPVEIGLNPIIETDEGTVALSAIVGISDRKEREQHIQAASRHVHQGMSGALIAFPLPPTYRR